MKLILLIAFTIFVISVEGTGDDDNDGHGKEGTDRKSSIFSTKKSSHHEHIEILESDSSPVIWEEVQDLALERMHNCKENPLPRRKGDDDLIFGDIEKNHLPGMIESGQYLPENVSWKDIFDYCTIVLEKLPNMSTNDFTSSLTNDVSILSHSYYEKKRTGQLLSGVGMSERSSTLTALRQSARKSLTPSKILSKLRNKGEK